MTEKHRPARVRFAPSPTGYLHLGGLRTALFDWLWAQRTGGQFILRIEDTDQKRYNPESLADVMASLRWLGLEWDEGPDVGGPHAPYIQSERQAIYQVYAEQLVVMGRAYRCYCTAEELEQIREEQRAQGKPMGYDRRHRFLTDDQRKAFEDEGRSHVIRFAAPLDGETVVHDLLRGEVIVESASVLDPVIIKGDGLPTYHLAAVVDDHLMEITDVLRGEEWLSSAPLHQQIYDAFGWTPPVLVHVPVILAPDGKGKMSKRKLVVAGKEYLALVHEFVEAGYLPDAMFNFLANVGWNYDPEQEVFSRAQAVARFDIVNINPTAAALPYPKLEWLNGVYIRMMAPAELQAKLAPYLAAQLGLDAAELAQSEKLAKLIPLLQERIKLLTEAYDKVDWAFVPADEITYPDPTLLIGKGLTAAQSLAVLEQGEAMIGGLMAFMPAALEEAFRAAAEAAGIKVGSYFAPFRVAITGRTVSPPLFESMEVLGQAETLIRVGNPRAALQAYALQAA